MTNSKGFSIAIRNHGKSELKHGKTSVGSSKSCDICIENEESISEEHATFEADSELLFVQDNFSKSGTFIGGKKLSSGKFYQVIPNQIIKLGMLEASIEFTIEVPKSPQLFHSQSQEEEETEAEEILKPIPIAKPLARRLGIRKTAPSKKKESETKESVEIPQKKAKEKAKQAPLKEKELSSVKESSIMNENSPLLNENSPLKESIKKTTKKKKIEISLGTKAKKVIKKEIESEEEVATDAESEKSTVVEVESDSFSAEETNVMRIMFTGVSSADYEEELCKIGGELCENWEDCDILVTDKIRRTVKFLCALASGKMIVSTNWLDSSITSGRFSSPEQFIVKDPVTERKFEFSLQDSIAKAKSQRLLEGLKFHVTKQVKPVKSEMKEIIEAAGGHVINSISEDCYVISTVDELQEDQVAYSNELILTGILQQEFQPDLHKLNK